MSLAKKFALCNPTLTRGNCGVKELEYVALAVGDAV